MKKTIVIVLLILLVLALVGMGGWVYFQDTYLVIGGEVIRRDVTELDLRERHLPEMEELVQLQELETLDLRGNAVSVEEYRQLQEALPDCEILWTIPFQGKYYAQEDTELTISAITDEEMAQLAYFEKLETIDATACTDLDAVLALQAAYPNVQVLYTVPLAGEQYAQTTGALTLADADAQELMDALAYLPKVTDVTFTGAAPENEAIYELKQAYPDVTFHWEFELLGVSVNADITEIDLSGIRMDSVEAVEESLKYFNCLERVTMCDTGLPSDEIDAMWKRNSDIRFVWNVRVGNFWVRTDATTLMPFQYGYDGTKGVYLYDNDCTEMKYLVDMVCIDFGHMGIRDISFLSYMPHMKYLILSDTYVSDLTPMENLKELLFFEAFLCGIRDITPLLGCTALEDANLANNPIQDITLLGQIESLNNIWISGVNWPQEQKDALNAAKPDAKIVYWQNWGSTGRGWRYLKNYYDHRDVLGMFYLDDDGNAYWERKEYTGD